MFPAIIPRFAPLNSTVSYRIFIPMKIAVANNINPSAPRIAASPDIVKKFRASGGCGQSGVPDAEFPSARATISADAVKDGDTVIKVKRLGAGKGAAERLCGLDRHAITGQPMSRVAVSIKVRGLNGRSVVAGSNSGPAHARSGYRNGRIVPGNTRETHCG